MLGVTLGNWLRGLGDTLRRGWKGLVLRGALACVGRLVHCDRGTYMPGGRDRSDAAAGLC